MYTKEDYKNYINQIIEIEIKMKEGTAALLPYVKIDRAREILEKISADEDEHKECLEKILKIIDDA